MADAPCHAISRPGRERLLVSGFTRRGHAREGHNAFSQLVPDGRARDVFYSVVAGELRRHEELALAFYELGPGQTRQRLACIIQAAVLRGELTACDCGQAAEELFGLWQGFTNFQLSLGIDVDAIRAGLPKRVERGVAVFMRTYGSRRISSELA